ncbi:unnamed protein product, partial [Sphenostylis stenocarpa]
ADPGSGRCQPAISVFFAFSAASQMFYLACRRDVLYMIAVPQCSRSSDVGFSLTRMLILRKRRSEVNTDNVTWVPH